MFHDVALLAIALFLAFQARVLVRQARALRARSGGPDPDLAQELATIKVTLDLHGRALHDLVETSEHHGDALRELIEANVDEMDDTRRRLVALERCRQRA